MNQIKTGGDIHEILKDSVEHEAMAQNTGLSINEEGKLNCQSHNWLDLRCVVVSAQALSAQPPNMMINQTLYHTHFSRCGSIRSPLTVTLSESQDLTQGPSPQMPTTGMTMDKTWHHTPAVAGPDPPHHPHQAPSPKQNPANKDTT
ncbi:hypothetical protein BS47DRAFT_1367876 [Hydnum rufescens UP504]|uniref:Uncharacterized protein n=1 Tax=Hydnum rufescens UP504 TaxID=1448309 RepID=A0A9P6AH50_9AGAM|nr:hypothetical protein BS47DRAFT_1367876 [Hydnum rufescens UP504]